MNVTGRFLHPTADLPAISELWAAALGAAYPIDRGHLGGVFRACPFILGAEADGELVGFTAATARSHAGSLAALVVAPRYRRHGIGGSLVDAALEYLAARDVAEVTLGEGGPYIWPGIPTDLRAAARFFLKRGWSPTGRLMDMVAETEALTVPDRIARLVAAADAQVRAGTSGDMEALLEFEQRNFPDWLPVAERYFEAGRAHDVLLAFAGGILVGSCFVSFPESADVRWRKILGEDTGAYGCLGVCPEARGKYFGYALAVKAGEMLRERGAARIYLGWVFSRKWYEALGFRPWRRYLTMSRQLEGVRSPAPLT